ncbi:limonene-1,2-epoxide hydrolase family protein [Henriciella litoralis]|uniref:limonene-1,2-epoxide hydrolase family protein n=1 Tax=Henriciella litoralis TaxID=568102 RepID=UPI0009FD49C2|nr:limonene-1,2-epoxide hydrolase family protein [Henriciella litoralis]
MSKCDMTMNFISAWNRKDVEAIMAAASEDIVYHNIPMEPVTGKAAFREALQPFISRSSHVDWKVLDIAESDSGAVLTERVDAFVFTDGTELSIRVMGVFEWNESEHLSGWRDYFDLAEFQRQMPG